MRWQIGYQLPQEYIPLLLHIKSLPSNIRKQLAKEIIPKNDDSLASSLDTDYGGMLLGKVILT
jgi:hypothetical protein